MSTGYRIEFTVQRITDDSDDFEDIGFGSSGEWDSMINSDITRYEWETEPGMPAPEDVKAGME
jgi:hypothetical protein